MIEKKDEGKRCRLVSNGSWGKENIRIHGEEALKAIFRIIEVFESEGELCVQLDRVFPKAHPYTPRWYAEKVELIDDNELDALT